MAEPALFVGLLLLGMVVYRRTQGIPLVWGPMRPLLDGVKESFLDAFRRANRQR